MRPTKKEAKLLLIDLQALKDNAIDLYHHAQRIGFEESSGDDDNPAHRVTPEIGNTMCQIDEAIGELQEYIEGLVG